MAKRANKPGIHRPASAAEPDPRGERLQKLIAAAGLASRRAAEQLIRGGRVSVNGRVVTQLGARAHPGRDRVRVDGRPLPRAERIRYYLVHKPRGVVTTTDDPQSRRTVMDLLPPGRERLFPVGRLDAASEGLVLLTNDGRVAQALLHPSFQVPRVYRVSIDGALDAAAMRQLSAGIELDGLPTARCELRLIERDPQRSRVEVKLAEGRRRQLRRMFEAVGHPVRRLLRVRFGPLRLGGLPPGEWRRLRPDEIVAIERMAHEALRGKGRGGGGSQDAGSLPASQSRGRRNSSHRRASGDPGSGRQS